MDGEIKTIVLGWTIFCTGIVLGVIGIVGSLPIIGIVGCILIASALVLLVTSFIHHRAPQLKFIVRDLKEAYWTL